MSFSHCLPAGKIKRWVFLTGPKSLLSSPLTVPMATSSSGAADGGCRPTSSTWPHKVGACVELRAGLCCCDSSCRQTENGPLLPAALQRALLAYKDIYKCDSVLRWHSRSSRRSFHKSLHQLTCLVSYRSYHGHSSFSSWPWNRAVWKRMGKQLGGSNDVTPPMLEFVWDTRAEDQRIRCLRHNSFQGYFSQDTKEWANVSGSAEGCSSDNCEWGERLWY